MSGENKNDHSVSARTPEQAAELNAMITAAVTEVFKSLAPVIQSMALTPEKLGAALREANRPYEDPEKIAKLLREQRESLKSKQDEAENRRADRARKDACPHLDANGRPSVCLVHNFPDHQPRGVCPSCHDWLHPREWRLGPPTNEFPRGKAYLVDAHKDYKMVMQLEIHS